MAIAFVGISAPVSTAGATTLTINVPAGIAAGNIEILALAFEGRAAGSGPWLDPSGSGPGTGVVGPGSGWKQVAFQAPSALGNGLEVWAAIYSSGTNAICNFTGSYPVVMVCSAWSGVYQPSGSITDGAVRAATTAQVSGNNPNAPSIYAFVNELVVTSGADQLTAGYGTPTLTGFSFTTRTDAARGGVAGNVEGVLSDALVAVEGNTGAIAYTATAASGGIGATATLAIRPSTSPAASTNPAIAMQFPSA